MANLNNGNNSGAGQHRNDKQQNYAHSNQHNPDNIRDNTRDHTYKEHDQTLTNDENYDENHKPKTDMDFQDTTKNDNDLSDEMDS